jgi:hypothetical protein
LSTKREQLVKNISIQSFHALAGLLDLDETDSNLLLNHCQWPATKERGEFLFYHTTGEGIVWGIGKDEACPHLRSSARYGKA